MPNRERICRLCLKECINNFTAIEDNTKETFDILLLKIDLSVSEEPVMCTSCAENLGKFFGFKSICLYTQGYVDPFINNKNSAKLGLRDVYLNKGESENSIGVPKGPNIDGFCMLCGLCMDPLTNCTLVSLDSKEGGVMLEKCLPELDLNITKKPIMCVTCHGFLEKYVSFVANCAIVEQKIKKYCEASSTTGKGPIELNDVLQFSSKNISSEHGDTCNIIKVEETFSDDGENTNEVENKNETCTEMKDHKFNGELQFSKKNMLNCQEDINKVEIIKIEGESYEEIKNKVGHNNENFLEMEDRKFLFNEEIEIKTDEHDFSSFQDDVLPQPEATINLSERPKVLLPYQCEYCSYRSKYKYKIRKHSMVHKNFSEVTMHQCDSCPYQTKYKENLKKHSVIHKNISEVTMHQCDSCPYQSKYKYKIKTHNLVHKDVSEVTMHQCDSCPFQTKYKDSLKKHSVIHKIPSDLTMYQCETCSYHTIRKCDFSVHVLIHKNPPKVKMYWCDSCSFQTNFKSNLKRHSITHHSPSNVTMYQCDSCPFKTKHKTAIKKHSVIHKNSSDLTMYQCETCSYLTVRKYDFNRHILTHKSSSKVKLYQCVSCSFQTKFKRYLKRHSIIHISPSEVKIHQCDYCSFQTKYKISLIRHRVMHKNCSDLTMY